MKKLIGELQTKCDKLIDKKIKKNSNLQSKLVITLHSVKIQILFNSKRY